MGRAEKFLDEQISSEDKKMAKEANRILKSMKSDLDKAIKAAEEISKGKEGNVKDISKLVSDMVGFADGEIGKFYYD